VVVLNIPSALTCLAYLPLIKKPLVVRVVGDEQEVSRVSTSLRCKIECSSRFLKLRELAEQYLLRKANAIICRNDKFKDKIVKKYGLSKSKISVIVPAINTDIFKPLDLNYRQKIKENLGLKASQLVIGFVSMYISRAKGAVTLLNAFSRLHNESPQVKLLLIGKDKLGLKKNPSIICCGLVNRNKLLHYYNAMDIVVFPSRSEGAAKVVMEAFACGIPVIASNVGATSDWIKDGETGFLVEPGDVNKIVDCCRKLLESEDLRTKIGEAARKYALQNFNHIEITKKNIDVIKGIIPKK
jgi:glycosyltransferase involved in cell wall biosynthesis